MLRGCQDRIVGENWNAKPSRCACDQSIMQLGDIIDTCRGLDDLKTDRNHHVVSALSQKIIQIFQTDGDTTPFRE